MTSVAIVEMLANARRVGKKAIDRNKSRDAWKDGEENKESHARRNRNDPVLWYVVVDTPKDVFPAPGRNVRRGGRAASPPVLTFSRRGISRLLPRQRRARAPVGWRLNQ
jgi:hypothetical protein